MTNCARTHADRKVRRINVGNWQIELLPVQAYESAYVPRTSVFGFAFDAQQGVHALGSDRHQRFATRASTLAYVPAGCDVFSASDDGGEYLRVQSIDTYQTPVQDRCFSNLVDRQAALAAHKLRMYLLSNDDADECEVLASALVTRVENMVAGAFKPSKDARSMTPVRMSRIDHLISNSIDEAPTVTDMANELGLSVGFFTRSFTAAVGRTPQEYLLDYRLSRARRQIANSTESLAVISAMCGFASHAHMTSQFRARLGVTPRQLRLKNTHLAQ